MNGRDSKDLTKDWTNWEKCGHHSRMEDDLKDCINCLSHYKDQTREEFKKINQRIGKLEGTDRVYDEKFITLFNQLRELTKWIKGLVMLGMGALATLFVWLVQQGGI